MSKQLVRTYGTIIAVENQRQVITPISKQINNDLNANPTWSIAHIVFTNGDRDCLVVYNDDNLQPGGSN